MANPWDNDPVVAAPWANDPVVNRMPSQSIGPIPEGDPVGQSTGQPIQEGRVPGFVTQAIGSLPTDPEQKRRILASQLFPDLDPKAAQARIFPGVGGRLAAVGQDGKAFYIEPAPSNVATDPYSPASIAGTLPRTDLPARAGSLAGPALPAVGGVGGGAIAGPTSVIAGPLAAAAGAAAGDILRQQGARYFDPMPGVTPYNYGQTAGEAVGSGIGQLFGAGLLRTFAPNRLGIRIGDLAPDVMQSAENINRLSQGIGVDKLTPGMLTGAPSILASEDAIASGAAGRSGSDIAGKQYGGLRNQLTEGFQKYVLDPISSAANKTDAAMQFQQGAEDAARIVRQQANALAKPSYDAARAGGQPLSPDLAQLMDVPVVQDAMTAAAKDYRTVIGKDAPNVPDFDFWNMTKQKLDDAYNVAKRAGENTTAAALDTVRKRLLINLDAAFPTYETARATSAPGIRLAARLQDSTGSAVGTGTERAESIVRPIFEQNNPRAIAEARAAFVQAGREDEWNAGTRAYAQSVFDNASKSQDGLNPATLRMQLWAKPGAKEAMQAAMDPVAFQGLENYMQVIEAAARARGMNSATAGRIATAEELKQAAETGGASAARFAGSVAQDITNPLRAFGIGTMAKAGLENVADRLGERGLQKMMQGIFSPDGMQFLRNMAAVSPGSEKSLTATSAFLGQQGADRRLGSSGPQRALPAR